MKRAKVPTILLDPVRDMWQTKDEVSGDFIVWLNHLSGKQKRLVISEIEAMINDYCAETAINRYLSETPSKETMERAADARLAASRNRKARR